MLLLPLSSWHCLVAVSTGNQSYQFLSCQAPSLTVWTVGPSLRSWPTGNWQGSVPEGNSACPDRGRRHGPEKPPNGQDSTETHGRITQALCSESQALPRTTHEPQALHLSQSFSAAVCPPSYLSSLCGFRQVTPGCCHTPSLCETEEITTDSR